MTAVEVRYLASVDDIQAVEIACQQPECKGLLRLDLGPGCVNNSQQCPRCGVCWWPHSDDPFPVPRLLLALMHHRANGRSTTPNVSPPHITFVFPAPGRTGAEATAP